MAFQSPIVAFSIKSCLWKRLQSNPINHTDNSPPSQGWSEWVKETHTSLLFSVWLKLQLAPYFKKKEKKESNFSSDVDRLCFHVTVFPGMRVHVQPFNQRPYWSADCWVRPSGPLVVRSCQGRALIMTGGAQTLEVWQAQGIVPRNNSLHYWHHDCDGSL